MQVKFGFDFLIKKYGFAINNKLANFILIVRATIKRLRIPNYVQDFTNPLLENPKVLHRHGFRMPKKPVLTGKGNH